MLTSNKYTPFSNGESSGPVICARIIVISEGLGTYAAIPGGGSVERRESSLVKRAFAIGVMCDIV